MDSLIKQPVHDRVILRKPDQGEWAMLQTEQGGLILADVGEMKLRKETVLSVGPACKAVKEGDTVAFKKESGMEFLYKGARYLVIRENDLEFIVNGEDKSNPE